MVSPTLLRKLWRDLLQRKAAFLALSAIVTVGVGIFVSMASVYIDLDGARERYYALHRLADFFVKLKRAPEWSAKEVSDFPNVRIVRGRVKLEVLVYLAGSVAPIQGAAISLPQDREPLVDSILLNSGAWFSGDEAEEAILEYQFAAARGLKPGDRIKVLLLDKQHDLLVVGTAMSPEFVYLIPPGGGLAPDPSRYGVMWLPRKFLQKSSDLQGAYNELIGIARDRSRIALQNTLEYIQERLDPYGVTYIEQARDQSSVSVLRDELMSLKTTAYIFPVIFLGVAGMVLNIMIGRLVAQQRSVIGTLRALGCSRGTIIRHYIGYGMVVGAVGGISGMLFGIWLQGVMLDTYRQLFAIPGIEAHSHPGILLIGLAIALAFGIAGTIKSASRAAALAPAEAMRPPPPEKGGAVVLERVTFFWKRLSFRWKMILRSVFRNPFRSMVSLLASTVATALVLGSLCLLDGLNYLMSYHFEVLAHEDITVSLRNPRGLGSLEEARHLPTVSRSEHQLVVVCDLQNGPFRKRTAVTGLAFPNRLYTPLDGTGRPLVIPDKGLILTRKLAEMLGVREGDVIRLRPLIARREEVTTPVVQVIDSFLGLSAYADIRYLSALLGEDWVSNTVLASTFQGAPVRSFMQEIRTRPTIIGIAERERFSAG